MNEHHADKVVELNAEEAKQVTGGQTGTTAIEYGLIGSIIGVAIIAGATALGQNLKDTIGSVKAKLK